MYGSTLTMVTWIAIAEPLAFLVLSPGASQE